MGSATAGHLAALSTARRPASVSSAAATRRSPCCTTDALDPWDLAELHGVEVIDITSTPRTDALVHFTASRPEAFSGAVLPDGNGAVIIENGSHAQTRRIATVTHELSHVLLEHPYHETLGGHDCTGTTGPLEQQADRLACELLVPRQAAPTRVKT